MIMRTITESINYGNLTPEEVKKIIFKYVVENGYEKGYWNGRYSTPSPTVVAIIELLTRGDTEQALDFDNALQRKWGDFNRYCSNLTLDPNDLSSLAQWFEKALASYNKEARLDQNDVKNLVGLVSSFLNNVEHEQRQIQRQERETEHQRQVASDSNVWVGEVGEVITLTVVEAKIVTYVHPRSYYASEYPLWKIKDDLGRTYSWGDTSGSVQLTPGMVIEGKVKDHSEYKGIKETKLFKVKVISERPRLGFFGDN